MPGPVLLCVYSLPFNRFSFFLEYVPVLFSCIKFFKHDFSRCFLVSNKYFFPRYFLGIFKCLCILLFQHVQVVCFFVSILRSQERIFLNYLNIQTTQFFVVLLRRHKGSVKYVLVLRHLPGIWERDKVEQRPGQNWGKAFKILGHKLKEAQGYTSAGSVPETEYLLKF